MIGNFDGKTVLVVGASLGIGAATARLLSDLGAALVLASRNIDATKALAAELTAQGRAASAIQVDVAHDGEVEHAVELAVDRYGSLDVAFNNAGIQ